MDIQLLCRTVKQTEKENNIHGPVVIPKEENGIDAVDLAGSGESVA